MITGSARFSCISIFLVHYWQFFSVFRPKPGAKPESKPENTRYNALAAIGCVLTNCCLLSNLETPCKILLDLFSDSHIDSGAAGATCAVTLGFGGRFHDEPIALTAGQML